MYLGHAHAVDKHQTRIVFRLYLILFKRSAQKAICRSFLFVIVNHFSNNAGISKAVGGGNAISQKNR